MILGGSSVRHSLDRDAREELAEAGAKVNDVEDSTGHVHVRRAAGPVRGRDAHRTHVDARKPGRWYAGGVHRAGIREPAAVGVLDSWRREDGLRHAWEHPEVHQEQ